MTRLELIPERRSDGTSRSQARMPAPKKNAVYLESKAKPAAAPAAPNDPRRVVVTAEAVPYIERFAEDENSDVMKRYQENLLTKKKIRDEKDAPKDILNLPIYRWSPFRDPNQSAFTSPILKSDDQFFVPNSMRPGSYVDDPYNGKK
jgi:hypothetical protein